ncbi:MAG: EAL domain-containing protein [Rhodospirillaceae bacterium]|nr:EAL domain-containing protein [Rhodospirillaceae bacterium]
MNETTPDTSNRPERALRHKWQRLSKAVRGSLIAGAVVSVLVALLNILAPAQLERIERLTLDWRFLMRGVEQPSGDVIIVVYDEASIRSFGRWPVSRTVQAQAIERVADQGAKAIGLDYLYLEPEYDLPAEVRKVLAAAANNEPADSPVGQEATRLATAAAPDVIMAEALARAGNVIMPFAYSPDSGSVDLPDYIEDWAYARTKGCTPELARQIEQRLQSPIPSLAKAARLGGSVNVALDVDGAPRFEYLITYFKDACFAPLSVASAAAFLDTPWTDVAADLTAHNLHLGGRVIPLISLTDPDKFPNGIVVNYFGPGGTIPTVSFADVISGRLQPDIFKGKLVLFGTGFLGGTDLFRTPFDPTLPGVERHATVADRLIHGGTITRSGWTLDVSVAAVLLLGGLSALLSRTMPSGSAITVNIGVAAAWCALTYYLLFWQFAWIDVFYPVLSIALNAVTQMAMRTIAEERSRRQAEIELRESEERYALAARGANDGLWDWDLVHNSFYTSARWQQMLGLRADRMSGQPGDWFDRVHRDDIDLMRAAIDAHLKGSSTHFEQELRMRHGEGSDRWVAIRGMAVRDASGKSTRFAGSMTDISGRKKAEQDLLFNAFHSHLTRLPNRALLIERTDQALQLWAKDPNADVVVAILDIDRFGHYNETLGQKLGDDILITLARSLEEAMRPDDTLAHLGEDEYAVTRFIAGNVEENVEELIITLKTVLGRHMEIEGRQIDIEASIGYVLASQAAGAAGDELLRDANLALYRAKAQGRGQVVRFEESMHQSAMKRFGLEADLKRAIIAGDQLELFYQPIIDFKGGHVHGFEALIRWRHPERGLISPVDFIPLAEDTDMIIDIGRKSIMDAARQIANWMPAEGDPPQIAVNVSGKQFAAVGLVEDIERALKVTGIPPHALKLEITESLIMDNPERTTEVLRRIIALGCKVSIDDFGTGYSSLSHLHRFPFHTLKVDRSFVMRITDSREGLEIVRVIASLAHILERDVVAEGVETEEQAAELKRLGIQFGQGYLYSKPLPAGEASVFLARSREKHRKG